MSRVRRRPRPPRAIREAAEQAAALVDVARAAAERRKFGIAVALEVLALEEAAKAQVLGMRWIAANAPVKVAYPDELLDRVLQNNHLSRHAFANVQLYKQDLARRLEAMNPFIRDSLDPPYAESRLVNRIKWLDQADRLKQRGFYVDPSGSSTPSRFTRKDYDEAAQIVEPYVAATVRQTESLT